MRRLLCILLLIINISVSGQKITFSPEILNSTDRDVKEIAALWKNYFESYSLKNDTTVVNYWNNEEIKSGSNDMIKYLASPQLPIYKMGNHITFDIRKLDDKFYEINTMFELGEGNQKMMYAIYRVCAKKNNGKYELYNDFYYNKQLLKSIKIGRISYYYPYSYPMDNKNIKDAKETVLKFENIQKYYRIEKNTPITYILANSIDECDAIIGLPYTMIRSYSKYAGLTIYPNTLLSCRPNHLHELIHGLFIPLYPNAPSLFHEGIATYYGGTCGEKFDFHVKQLQAIINSKPDADLSNFDNWDKLIEDKTNPFYTIGAVFIDYAIKIGGAEKVLALFKYPSTNEGIYAAINSELGIKKDKINSFLKDYINNYKKKQK